MELPILNYEVKHSMRTISLGIPDNLLDEIDILIEKNNIYGSRSEVLRQAIEDLLNDELEYYKSKSL